MEENKCLQCGRELYGRPDKKFCSEECRYRYHNAHNSSTRLLRSRVITALNRNYRVLCKLVDDGITRISLYDIECLGFRPEICTSCTEGKDGKIIKRCFDIRYGQTPKHIFKIRKITPEVQKASGTCR